MSDLLSRNLGKTRKAQNCSITSDPQPSSAAEDALARYQQKISTEFVDHFTLDDNPFEDAGLASFSDLQTDRDDMLDECDATATLKRQEKHAEAAFEKMMNEKSSDWFSENSAVDDSEEVKNDEGAST